jgi:diguanylate cyclase (GGDEF)-like protein
LRTVLEMDIPVVEPSLLATAFARSHVAVVVLGHEGVLLAANPAACGLLGDGKRVDPDLLLQVAAVDLDAEEGTGMAAVHRFGARDCRLHRVLYRAPSGEPFAVLELIDVTDLRHRELQLLERLERDTLTGVASRDAFFAAAKALISERRRAFRPLSVAMIDLDDFKVVNDEAGHAAGDRVLAGVAECCRQSLRDGDVIGRLGGDEFAALLPGAGPVDAQTVIDRIRTKLACAGGTDALAGRTVTLSIGLALYRDGEGDIGPAMKRADQALYAAKPGIAGRRQRAVG